MKICAAVPSLNPDTKLLDVVKGLREKGFTHIILVNDGSTESTYFDMLKGDDCVVLTHEVNKGKGRAMKTAMEYYLKNYARICDGMVFCDGDNQHSSEDIVRCSEALGGSPDALVLGVRDFSGDNVPKRSRMGNRTMSLMFKLIGGLTITDTQTGLRAMGNKAIEEFVHTKGERFEYETNMLLETKRLSIDIVEVKIETIYIEENKSSHYNTFRDSFRIFKILLKFAWVSVMSCIIDVFLFWAFCKIFSFLPNTFQQFIGQAVARVISSIFNYTMNYTAVFKSKRGLGTMPKYYLLCICQLVIAYFLTLGLTALTNSSPDSVVGVVIKAAVDFFLFFVSFRIQRDHIFQKKEVKK